MKTAAHFYDRYRAQAIVHELDALAARQHELLTELRELTSGKAQATGERSPVEANQDRDGT